MKEMKEKIEKILIILKKIDNITSSSSLTLEKMFDIVDTAATKAATLVIDTAATNAATLVDTAATNAATLVDAAANKAAIRDSKIDNTMYVKCLIHEMRTPINNITIGINHLEIAMKEHEKNNEILNTIDGLHKSLHFMEDILTNFCLIKNGSIVLNNFTVFSIHKMIRDVENLLKHNMIEKNINFKYNIDDNVYDMVNGDEVNLKLCLVNLIKNAIKYGNPFNTIIINIYNFNEDNRYQSILIAVSDNNSHITKKIKDNLFKPFNSTSGSGLGLYICKNILNLHNGTIEHEYSNTIDGNQFNIFIDLKIQDGLNTEKKSILNDSSEIKFNIIIIDDSEITLKLMYKIFEKYNKINKIITAKDGSEALQKIYDKTNEIDIVFIDNQMPILNGTQTVQLLRGIKFNKIIIGISGSVFSESNDFNNCGIDYMFSKPFNKDKVELIMSFLNKDNVVRQSDKKIKLNHSQLEWD